MAGIGTSWGQGAAIRLAGLVLLTAGYLAMRWLFHAARPHHDDAASAWRYLAAAAGFLCLSGGGMLTALGRHIFDPVEIAERWTRRPHILPPPGAASQDAAPRRP